MQERRKQLDAYSITARVHAGKGLTCFEAFMYLCANTAITVATGFFLWNISEGNIVMSEPS